ncbi:MAG: transposase [Gallicola sp.]|nr:transposase [Gallicola sp.]
MTKYTDDFRKTVCKEVQQAKTYAEVSKKYDVSVELVRKWSRQYEKYGDLAFDPDGPRLFEERRVRDLERENEDLREENAILKKAAAYFSKSNQ